MILIIFFAGNNTGEYLGCFEDSSKKRLLEDVKEDFKDENSVSKCISFCLTAGQSMHKVLVYFKSAFYYFQLMQGWSWQAWSILTSVGVVTLLMERAKQTTASAIQNAQQVPLASAEASTTLVCITLDLEV